MIYFVVREDARWGIEDYLADRGVSLASTVGLLTYEELPGTRELPVGSYVFTQRDDLLAAELEMVQLVWSTLASLPFIRLLNDPSRTLGRYGLIRDLRERGLNDYDCARATEEIGHLRFPVFIREERRHTGSLTSLIHSTQEFDQALGELLVRGWRPRDLMVVEFWDTRDDQGFYRKHSAYVVGKEIIPRSLLFSRHWMVKSSSKIVDEEAARRELEYVRSNPHAEWLKAVFACAGIDYGRIDYGVLDDRPQAWEINLYPTLVRPHWKASSQSSEVRALRQPARAIFSQRFEEALRALDVKPMSTARVSIPMGEDLLHRIQLERHHRRRQSRHQRIFRKLAGMRFMHPLWRALSPLAFRFGSTMARRFREAPR